jgi:hypothetical protein
MLVGSICVRRITTSKVCFANIARVDGGAGAKKSDKIFWGGFSIVGNTVTLETIGGRLARSDADTFWYEFPKYQ